MREKEAKLFKDPARCGIRWVVTGEERPCLNRLERIGDDRASCFFGQPLPPKCRTEVETEFVDFFFGLIWTEAGAPGKFFSLEMKQRPILDAVKIHR